METNTVPTIKMVILPLCFFVLYFYGGCVLSAYHNDAPIWSDNDDNTVLPEVRSRAKDDLSDDDRILQIFNNCECVMYYLCDDDNYIITDGKAIFSPR